MAEQDLSGVGEGAEGGLWDWILQEAPMLYCGEHIGTGQDPMVRALSTCTIEAPHTCLFPADVDLEPRIY